MRNTLPTEELPHCGPTHHRPALPLNTLLTVDLPHCETPYSLWTCPTTEHPTHLGSSPPRNNLITVDPPHRGPTSPWNTVPTKDLPQSGTPYSPWTCATAEPSTHQGPSPHGTPYSLNRRRPLEKITTYGKTTENTQTLQLID